MKREPSCGSLFVLYGGCREEFDWQKKEVFDSDRIDKEGKGACRVDIRETDMIRKIRLLEELKADLAVGAGAVIRSIAGGVRVEMMDAISRLIVSCYVLARHLGIGYEDLDHAVDDRLREPLDAERQKTEDWYGDYRTLRRYRRLKE